jgi:pimeloyl-ACP methyl ester carboxylesterase
MDVRPVELTTADGLQLVGERWGAGADWLVLVHDTGLDLDCWRGLAPLVAARPDSSALAVDLRGHGGSTGAPDPDACVLDVEAAIALAREEGAASVSVAGAGTGALAALRVAERARPDALVLLSPGPLDGADLAALRGVGIAKLLFVGALDPGRAEAAAALRRASIGQILVVSLPTRDQGTELLAGPWADQVEEHIGAFFDEQRSLAGAPLGRRPAPLRGFLGPGA